VDFVSIPTYDFIFFLLYNQGLAFEIAVRERAVIKICQLVLGDLNQDSLRAVLE
jgi:hypothetical protein